MRNLLFATVAVLASSPAFAADPAKLELKDGDRIVYLGNTFVERDANYGYLESLLTIRHPDINFTFRNLGWSGDTVWGDARARFGTRADGFQHLKDHVLALKPTIILVAYGMNESFAGEAGLAEFESGLNTLLDTLAETKAKIVLISPQRHEKLPPPLPDPAKHNADIALYRDAIAKMAQARGAGFVDGSMLPAQAGAENARLTEDGIHPTPLGYSCLARALADQLDGPRSTGRSLSIDTDGKVSEADGWEVENLRATDRGWTFDAQADHLPRTEGWTLMLTGASKSRGAFGLKVDETPVPMSFLTGNIYTVQSGPETDQVEKLRTLINKKNELYFHRWRPQNETYLFGFRKHEQGNNAVEIPQFDPLIAEIEAEINTLKKPMTHAYEITREEAGK